MDSCNKAISIPGSKHCVTSCLTLRLSRKDKWKKKSFKSSFPLIVGKISYTCFTRSERTLLIHEYITFKRMLQTTFDKKATWIQRPWPVFTRILNENVSLIADLSQFFNIFDLKYHFPLSKMSSRAIWLFKVKIVISLS